MNTILLPLLIVSASFVGAAFADAPKVLAAKAIEDDGRWKITVTMSHEDTGWDHYAKGFELLTPDKKRVAYGEETRPHVGKKSFDTTLTGITLPPGIPYLLIRTRCSLVGWASETERLDLPGR